MTLNGPGSELDKSRLKCGVDFPKIQTTFSKSLFSCYWHLVSLLVVLYLIEKYHNANKHTNRCTIITTNEIFIVTYLPGSSKLDTFKSLY